MREVDVAVGLYKCQSDKIVGHGDALIEELRMRLIRSSKHSSSHMVLHDASRRKSTTRCECTRAAVQIAQAFVLARLNHQLAKLEVLSADKHPRISLI